MSNYDTKIYRLKELVNDFYGKSGPSINQPLEKGQYRQRQSCYLITINSNQRVNRNSQKDRMKAERFRKTCELFCKNIKVFIETWEGWPTDDKRTVELVPHIEVSDDRNLLHIHINTEIIHSSKIQMNLPMMHDYFEHKLGHKVKIQVKWYPGSKITNEQRVKDYVMKGVGGYDMNDMDIETVNV